MNPSHESFNLHSLDSNLVVKRLQKIFRLKHVPNPTEVHGEKVFDLRAEVQILVDPSDFVLVIDNDSMCEYY